MACAYQRVTASHLLLRLLLVLVVLVALLLLVVPVPRGFIVHHMRQHFVNAALAELAPGPLHARTHTGGQGQDRRQ